MKYLARFFRQVSFACNHGSKVLPLKLLRCTIPEVFSKM